METKHVSKVIHVFQITCSCLLDTWKKKYKFPITSLSLHWAIYWHNPVYISAGQGGSLMNMHNVHILYYLLLLHCLPLCGRGERERCVRVLGKHNLALAHNTGDSRRLNKVWPVFFKEKKVPKGVYNFAKLATLCISICPTTGRATAQTENTHCVNRALIKLVQLKGICVNFDSTNIYIYIYINFS